MPRLRRRRRRHTPQPLAAQCALARDAAEPARARSASMPKQVSRPDLAAATATTNQRPGSGAAQHPSRERARALGALGLRPGLEIQLPSHICRRAPRDVGGAVRCMKHNKTDLVSGHEASARAGSAARAGGLAMQQRRLTRLTGQRPAATAQVTDILRRAFLQRPGSPSPPAPSKDPVGVSLNPPEHPWTTVPCCALMP